MNIQIVIPTPVDAEQVYEIFKQTWLSTYQNIELDITAEDILGRYPPEKREQTIKEWQEFYGMLQRDFQKSETKVWITKAGEGVSAEVLGVVTVDEIDPQRVGALYVPSKWQGQGIGSQLMQHALDYIGPDKPSQLNVASYNSRAIKFYESLGFKVVGKVPDEVGRLPSGKVIPELNMRRD